MYRMLRGASLQASFHITRRRLKEDNIMANGGVIVAIVFAGLIFLAVLITIFCRKYDAIRKCFWKNTKMKKKRDKTDYKATEIVIKTLDKPFPIIIMARDGDSATASVVTAAANETVAGSVASGELMEGYNDGFDMSESSWTTLGNTASIGIEPIPLNENTSILQRSPRWETKVVPVNYHDPL